LRFLDPGVDAFSLTCSASEVDSSEKKET
jgi:hypothetical protein